MPRRSLSFALALILAGCSSVLGLDEFTDYTGAGAGGDVGAGGTATTSSASSGGGAGGQGSGGQGAGGGGGEGGGSTPVIINCKKNGDAIDLLAAGSTIDNLSGEPFFLLRGSDATIYIGALVTLEGAYTRTLRLLSFDKNGSERSADIDVGSAQAFANAQMTDGKLDIVIVSNQALLRYEVPVFGGGIFSEPSVVNSANLPAECVGNNSPYGFTSAFIDHKLRFGLSCIQRGASGAPLGVSLHYGDDSLQGALIESRTGGTQEELLVRSVGYSPATGAYLMQTGYQNTDKGPIEMRIGSTAEALKLTHPYATSTASDRDTSLLGLLPLLDGSGVFLASVDAKFNSADLSPKAHMGVIPIDGETPWTSSFVKDVPIEGLSSLSKFSSLASDDEYIYASGTRIQLADENDTVTYSVFAKNSSAPAVLGFEVYKAAGLHVQNSASLPLGTGNFYVAWQEADTGGQVQAIRAAKIICSSAVEP